MTDEPRSICPHCDGTGYDDVNHMGCSDCHATGYVVLTDDERPTVAMLDAIAAGCMNDNCPRYNIDMPYECDDCHREGPPCAYGIRGCDVDNTVRPYYRCDQHNADYWSSMVDFAEGLHE